MTSTPTKNERKGEEINLSEAQNGKEKCDLGFLAKKTGNDKIEKKKLNIPLECWLKLPLVQKSRDGEIQDWIGPKAVHA